METAQCKSVLPAITLDVAEKFCARHSSSQSPTHPQRQYFYSNQSRTQGFVINCQHFISLHKTFPVKPFRCWRARNLKRTEKKSICYSFQREASFSKSFFFVVGLIK